jgi:hypothetical protein
LAKKHRNTKPDDELARSSEKPATVRQKYSASPEGTPAMWEILLDGS